jgi:hypothetical protein
MILMGLLALVLTLGSFIPQIPPQADPQAWLAVQTGPFGQWNGLLRSLGLFDLYHSLWFRLLLILAGLALFVRAVDSFELAWQAVGRKPWTAEDMTFWGNAPPQIRLPSSLSVEATMARLNEYLTGNGYWWTEVSAETVSILVIGRRMLVFWARTLSYVALLLALVGLAITGDWGWQGGGWQPVPGESRAVGNGTPYVVRLDTFHMNLVDDQRLQEVYSEVTWLEGNAELGKDVVRTGHPSKRQGVTLRQMGYVPVVRMRGWDDEGRRLILETEADVLSVAGEAEFRFSSTDAQPIVLVSGHDLLLALTFQPMCAEGRPALYLDRIGGGGAERQMLGILYESGSVSVDDLQLEVDLAFAPVLRVDYRPGMGLVVAGMALAVVALLVIWIVPPRLAWITVRPGDEQMTLVQVLVFPDTGTSRWLPDLSSHLQGVLADDV